MIHKNIENTLIKQNPHWKSVQEKSQYIKRDFLRNINLNSKFIEIIVGVRRGGKSTAFKIFIDSLIQQKKAKAREILFLNFDNPNFTSLYDNVGDLDLLIEQAEVLTGYKIKYLFLDEIQNINLWEKWVKAAYDQNDFKKIFITGSNSSLLESKYISLLSGRHFSYINFPFSFKEFLAAKKISLADDKIDILRNKHNILKLFDQYLKLGGFPEVVIDKDVNIINSYYQTILLKDVVVNFGIRDLVALKELSYYLITNCCDFFSYNKIAKQLKLNEKTVLEYIDHLKSAHLFFEIKKFDYSLKKQNINKKKIYSIDNGFINQIGFSFSENNGRYLENLIALDLLRRNEEFYYHRNMYECDFVLKKNTKIYQAIQVCYDFNTRNKDREIRGVLEAIKDYNLSTGIIISRNQKEEILIDGKKILIIPAWEWLLNVKN
jgi:uncharacterized protein